MHILMVLRTLEELCNGSREELKYCHQKSSSKLVDCQFSADFMTLTSDSPNPRGIDFNLFRISL